MLAPVIAWALQYLRRRPPLRLRQPQNLVIYTGCAREAIDATFDEAGRIITLIVHTRLRSLHR